MVARSWSTKRVPVKPVAAVVAAAATVVVAGVVVAAAAAAVAVATAVAVAAAAVAVATAVVAVVAEAVVVVAEAAAVVVATEIATEIATAIRRLTGNRFCPGTYSRFIGTTVEFSRWSARYSVLPTFFCLPVSGQQSRALLGLNLSVSG